MVAVCRFQERINDENKEEEGETKTSSSSVTIASATLPGLMRILKEEFENDQCEIYQVDDGNNPEMEMSKKKGQ